LVFKAGPLGLRSKTTDGHAQWDNLSVDISGYKRPLIEDPGIGSALYNNEPKLREWIKTAPAHNTINVDSASPARSNAGAGFSDRTVTKTFGGTPVTYGQQITGWTYGYVNIDSSTLDRKGYGPAISRTVWHNQGDKVDTTRQTFIAVDWVQQGTKAGTTPAAHTFEAAFLVPVKSGSITGHYSSGGSKSNATAGIYTETSGSLSGNVYIKSLVPTAPDLSQTKATVLENALVTAGSYNDLGSAWRFRVKQTGVRANFITVIHTAAGQTEASTQVPTVTIVSQTSDAVELNVTEYDAGGTTLTTRKLRFANPFFAGTAPMPTASVFSTALHPLTTKSGNYPPFYSSSSPALGSLGGTDDGDNRPISG